VRYILARLEDEQRATIYRLYIANSLYYAPQNKIVAKTLQDIWYPVEEDTRTGDDIAMDIIQKAGLSFGG